MKKILSLTSALMLLSTFAYGANDSLKIAAKTRMRVTDLVDVHQKSNNPLSGCFPSWGLSGEYAFNDNMGVQLSFEYYGYKRGSDEFSATNNRVSHSNSELSNFAFAVVPRFYSKKYPQLCAFIGPRVSWLSNKINSTGGKYPRTGSETHREELAEEETTHSTYAVIDGGLLVGLEYEFDNGITLGADSNIGLMRALKRTSKTYKDSDSSRKTEIEGRLLSHGITLGYNLAKLF